MNILDEHMPPSQRQLLRSWRVPIRQIGYDIAHKGIKDHEIVPFLFTLRQPTFFTLDLGFFNRALCHQRYCIVFMDVRQYEAARFARQLLSHPDLATRSQRMGTVMRLSHSGITVWRIYAQQEAHVKWLT